MNRRQFSKALAASDQALDTASQISETIFNIRS